MMKGGPFKLPSKEEAEAEKRKRAALKQVKQWVEQAIPDEYLADRTCCVDVSEAQCGDPDCAPIDTVVRIIFENQCGCVFGVPCEAWEVEENDIDEAMPPTEMFHEWKKGNNLSWPTEPVMPEPGEAPEVELRFPIGARVECCVNRGPDGWSPGTVVAHWYRAATWPTGQFAPYQIKLDGHDSLIFAPQDRDNCIRGYTGFTGELPATDVDTDELPSTELSPEPVD